MARAPGLVWDRAGNNEHHPEREEEEGDFATGEEKARDTHEAVSPTARR